MACRITDRTPKQDGFFMPAEFSPIRQVWMLWPERPDNWRDGAKPAQAAYARVAEAVARFADVTVGVSCAQYENCRAKLPPSVRVVEIASDDAWVRDCGPTFLKNAAGETRAADWEFNAWGGLYDGAYFPWNKDAAVARKICEIERVDSYRPRGFVLEGGSFHVDGEGTVLTTEMCLLSPGRNPHLDKAGIERMLCEYLGAEKVLWLKDGIDPDETNGHVDDVACFVRPGEAACIWTDDEAHPFYRVARESYEALCAMTDARGRRLKVHKVCLPKVPVRIGKGFSIDAAEGSFPRQAGEVCPASYLNFLIVNGGVIVPQFGDENDALALAQLAAIFPDKEVVGVDTREVVYGGGNVHCITQQQPR